MLLRCLLTRLGPLFSLCLLLLRLLLLFLCRLLLLLWSCRLTWLRLAPLMLLLLRRLLLLPLLVSPSRLCENQVGGAWLLSMLLSSRLCN